MDVRYFAKWFKIKITINGKYQNKQWRKLNLDLKFGFIINLLTCLTSEFLLVLCTSLWFRCCCWCCCCCCKVVEPPIGPQLEMTSLTEEVWPLKPNRSVESSLEKKQKINIMKNLIRNKQFNVNKNVSFGLLQRVFNCWVMKE